MPSATDAVHVLREPHDRVGLHGRQDVRVDLEGGLHRWVSETFADDLDRHEAAEIAERTREALIDARIDFCAETVFSHASKVDLVTTAVAGGYDVVLHAVLIPLRLSGPRVAKRVAAGGHDVPEEEPAGRYDRLWPLIAEATPHCYRAVFWNNAPDDGPFEVASYRYGIADYLPRWPDWTPEPLLEL